MHVQKDFADLFALLNAHKADFIIIGAAALNVYGVPRYDILVRPDGDNARGVLAALAEFGFDAPDLTPADFSVPGKTVSLGEPPVRVKITTSHTGMSWEEASAATVEGDYQGIKVFYLRGNQLRFHRL
ncbi:MAG: hypothetical protein PHG91_08870 [Syntrophales bacterium]|nr:hypothetical protein [Syntrophales bacterium]